MVSKHFTKGKEILVSGQMLSRKRKDKEGNNRIVQEVFAEKIDFCGSKSENDSKPKLSGNTVPNFEQISKGDLLPFQAHYRRFMVWV